MSGFHFLRFELLLLILPFFTLAFFLVRSKKGVQLWNAICSHELLPYVVLQKGNRSSIFSLFIFSTLFLLIAALAGPAWKLVSQPLVKSQAGLVIALDLSESMNADDVKPSRLQRAIYKINDFLNEHREGQTALIVFSGEPFVVTPLTDDIATIQALIPALDTTIMPVSGHHVHKAISKAVELLAQGGVTNGSVLLVASELSQEDREKAIEIGKRENLKIAVLGVGTEEGTPIPKKGGGFITDVNGALLISKLSQKNLNQLAASTGGTYKTMSLDDQDIHDLSHYFSSAVSIHSQEISTLKHDKWHDEGYWLVLCALPFFSLLFRRGILITLFFIIPHTLQAFSWNDLWKTDDQQASALFQQEKYEQAKELFHDSDWKAASYYKLGEFETAAELFQGNETAEGLFNLGTAKAKQGDFKAALDAYNKTIELQPTHEDAQYNKKLLEEFLEKQKQEKQKNGKKQDKDDSQQKDSNKDQQQENDDGDPSSDGQKEEEKNKQNESSAEQKSDSDKSEKEKQELNGDQDDKDPESSPMDKKEQEELQEHYKDQVEKELQEGEETPLAQSGMKEEDEDERQQQIDERWLQRVKDDPGGLLRRKFLQQYRGGDRSSLYQQRN